MNLKKFALLLILSLFFVSVLKSNEIKDFEIGKMTIGDSLLSYYSINEIEQAKKVYYPSGNKEFFDITLRSKIESEYKDFQFALKSNDKEYKIYNIMGIDFIKDITDCNFKRSKISKEILTTLNTNSKLDYENNYGNRFGTSIAYISDFKISNGLIRTMCIIWDKKNNKVKNFTNNMAVSFSSSEYMDWLDNKAY